MNRQVLGVGCWVLGAMALTATCAGNPYDHAMRRVRLLSNSPHVRLIPFGKSHQGRAIPAFVISDFAVTSEKKARVMVCAGQHGDERNPVTSVMSLCGKLASGSRPDLLRRCVFIVVPIVNPDGFAAGKRLNARGLDINRDWKSLQTREARFVDDVIRAWRPHALIDAHEWTGPTLTPGNEIESPPTATKSQSQAMIGLARRWRTGRRWWRSGATRRGTRPYSTVGIRRRATRRFWSRRLMGSVARQSAGHTAARFSRWRGQRRIPRPALSSRHLRSDSACLWLRPISKLFRPISCR